MLANRDAHRRAVSTTVLCVALFASGCGMIGEALGRPGPDRDPAQAGSREAPSERAAAPDVTRSVYEYGPTTKWPRYTRGRPSFPAYGFLAGPTPFSCALAPRGTARVLPIPGEVTMTPLLRWGPAQVGVAGMAWENAWSLAHGRGDATATLLEGASRLETEGEGCRFTAFLYVSLWPSKSQPVSVLRE